MNQSVPSPCHSWHAPLPVPQWSWPLTWGQEQRRGAPRGEREADGWLAYSCSLRTVPPTLRMHCSFCFSPRMRWGFGFPWCLSSKKSACKARDAGDSGLISGSRRSPGGGHGNPLQYSCLENPMDRGAWWAIVHGVAKSWRRVKQLSMHARGGGRWIRRAGISNVASGPHSFLASGD